MGAQIACSVRLGRRVASGAAVLETDRIEFRSPSLRLKIPFDSIEKLAVRGNVLNVTHLGGTASFGIGEKRAEAWATKIRNPKSLLDKLGIKPDNRVVALGVTDSGFLERLMARAPDISMRLRKDADAVIYQADSVAALDKLKQIQPKIKRDGMIWLITPKGKGGISYPDMLAASKSAGLVDVKISAYNATHAATKLVIPKALRQGPQ